MSLINKRVLIIENDYQQFSILREIVSDKNRVFPGPESSDNQEFITDVLSFLYTGPVRKPIIAKILRENIEKSLGGVPEVIFLDWSLENGAEDNYTGNDFNVQFLKENYPNAVLVKISQYFSSFSEDVPGKEYSVAKFSKGSQLKNMTDNLSEIIKKIFK